VVQTLGQLSQRLALLLEDLPGAAELFKRAELAQASGGFRACRLVILETSRLMCAERGGIVTATTLCGNFGFGDRPAK
jgi:hypothetical protein